jgi:hypothetical protein
MDIAVIDKDKKVYNIGAISTDTKIFIVHAQGD